MEKVKNSEFKNFEKQFSRLQAIVQELESESLALEKGMALYREGMLCSQNCASMLENARHQLQKWQNGEAQPLNVEAEPSQDKASTREDIPF
ncbi:MAG: exodeoxyribonuclease VII small subunit [Desulfovibrio sp.]|nr:exodeoxyribonuclease VII small subunit [Desulfovibrio sp.]